LKCAFIREDLTRTVPKKGADGDTIVIEVPTFSDGQTAQLEGLGETVAHLVFASMGYTTGADSRIVSQILNEIKNSWGDLNQLGSYAFMLGALAYGKLFPPSLKKTERELRPYLWIPFGNRIEPNQTGKPVYVAFAKAKDGEPFPTIRPDKEFTSNVPASATTIILLITILTTLTRQCSPSAERMRAAVSDIANGNIKGNDSKAFLDTCIDFKKLTWLIKGLIDEAKSNLLAEKDTPGDDSHSKDAAAPVVSTDDSHSKVAAASDESTEKVAEVSGKSNPVQQSSLGAVKNVCDTALKAGKFVVQSFDPRNVSKGASTVSAKFVNLVAYDGSSDHK